MGTNGRNSSMNTITITLEQLRGMIGQRVIYQGCQCQVIEVLEQETELVLQLEDDDTIQTDQHGDARRRVPATITIPVLTADRREINPRFLSLDLL